MTVQRETHLLRPFLAARVVGDVLGLGSLTAGEVTAFMLAHSESASPATVRRTGTALRSLLRFLHLRGMIDTSLAGAVPTAANWKQAGLPKYLTPEQTRMLLASCDPATAVGCRDVAILTLLARLGRRAGEVVEARARLAATRARRRWPTTSRCDAFRACRYIGPPVEWLWRKTVMRRRPGELPPLARRSTIMAVRP